MAKTNRKVFFSFDQEDEYEVTVTSYVAPDRGDFDTPPDCGELDFSPTVTRTSNGNKAEEVSFEDFISRYAESMGMSQSSAEDLFRDHAMLDIAEQFMDEAEDHRETVLEEESFR